MKLSNKEKSLVLIALLAFKQRCILQIKEQQEILDFGGLTSETITKVHANIEASTNFLSDTQALIDNL